MRCSNCAYWEKIKIILRNDIGYGICSKLSESSNIRFKDYFEIESGVNIETKENFGCIEHIENVFSVNNRS